MALTGTKSIFGKRFAIEPGTNRFGNNPGSGGNFWAGGSFMTAAAASSPVTNTTTETLFDNYITIPPNSLGVGSLILLRWQGIATATNSTDTLAIKAYIGGLSGTLLFTHAATDVANDNVFQGEYELIIRTIGASGTMVGCGWGKSVPAAEGTATFKDDILASTAIDTTVAQVIGCSATWSVANAGNSCRLDFLRVGLA